MATLVRPLIKTLLSPSPPTFSICKTISLYFQQELPSLQFSVATKPISLLNPKLSHQSPRTYTSDMRLSALEGNIIRLLRNQLQYELEHSPSTDVSNCFIQLFNCFFFLLLITIYVNFQLEVGFVSNNGDFVLQIELLNVDIWN